MTKKGQYLGGIRTVEDVRRRCRENRENGCWHWPGSNSDGTPTARINGSCVSLRRWVLRQTKPLQTGVTFVVPKCGNQTCVAPAHAVSKRGDQYMRWLNDSGAINTPAQKQKVKEAVRTRKLTKLTPAKAVACAGRIRAQEDPKEVAKSLGIAVHHALKVARGECWAEYVKGIFP